MALDVSVDGLNRRIESLRTGFAGYSNTLLTRNRAYLRAFSPEFSSTLLEHDQWTEPILAEDAGHTRSSFNISRAVPELWAALEASALPAIRWSEGFLPVPAPSMDPQENAMRHELYRATKLRAQQISTMREQILLNHARRARLGRHFYRAVLRKNVYGHSWLKSVPDESRQTFTVYSNIDPSTVYPIWSSWDETKLDAVLVAYRQSARLAAARYPSVVQMDDNGITVSSNTYYTPTPARTTDADRSFVWVEDYWVVDEDYTADTESGPIRSLVVNALRVNGKMAQTVEYPGWNRVPYFLLENENERDRTGFSDVGTVLPFQDALNKFLSEQQDVIHGEARPKFKARGDANREYHLSDEGIISLDQDEDIEQIAVHLDVFPTQVHGQQLQGLMSRATGLPPVVFGEIQAAQNSGRALSTAWRATASRMVPRTLRNGVTLDELFGYWVDCLELHGWDSARDLYAGNRDFAFEWPNQEPRDFQEVTLDAINRYNAGAIDIIQLMEDTGEDSPDEMDERVRAEYTDPVRHPEKAQSYLQLQDIQLNMQIKAAQAGQQAATIQAQLAQYAAQPPGGAPSGATGPSSAQGAAAAQQARVQAAQQAAPGLAQNQNVPATQAASPANAGAGAGTQVSTLIQDGGAARNRIIQKRNL